MIIVNDVLNYLSQKYPLNTACTFDNVGLLVGDGNTTVTKVVVCLDCDINAVSFAAQNGAQLIVTHHPVIFDGLKSVTDGSVVYELVKNGISVISMHTNLDIAEGGVTERLCETIGLKNITPYTAHDGFLIRSAECETTTADNLAQVIKSSLNTVVRYADSGNNINRVLVCSGSGGDFLTDVIDGGFDALIAADIKHNVFINALNHCVTVFDAGHYNSENIIVKPLCKTLSNEFDSIDFLIFNNEKIKTA
ncbi:MAG: Nif3-like dinuclear metal center hexameric protein [Clostridia bacterium]|nr:Nif3-like dinuclear metal center hexameric protein [Clostridia bacterium]